MGTYCDLRRQLDDSQQDREQIYRMLAGLAGFTWASRSEGSNGSVPCCRFWQMVQ